MYNKFTKNADFLNIYTILFFYCLSKFNNKSINTIYCKKMWKK